MSDGDLICKKGAITRGDTEWVMACGSCDKTDIFSEPRKSEAVFKFAKRGWRYFRGKWYCSKCIAEVKHE